MKQVFLSGQGQIDVFDAPIPGRLSGSLLVRNACSLISIGTEGAAITKYDGIKGLYEKALSSRGRLDQVWNMAKGQGITSTMNLIQNKLKDYTPIGYSSAGIVLETDSDCLEFRPGQRVACMGAGFANHAEYVVIPGNLAVTVPENVTFDEAAFAAIACIAMQGIRRLELSPGEKIAIVGLGLIGQVALRLVAAMGYQVYGLDVDEKRVMKAKQAGFIRVINSALVDPVQSVLSATNGVGVDGVVICASAKVDSVINQAFDLCRKRGRVSVVGDVGLGLERAKMYAKELEVRLSCSYGVGRYDQEYEIEGRDYPLPYVRWTERRNLEYFLNLLEEKRLDLSDLISEKISINEAGQAYKLIKSADTDIYGVLLDYHIPSRPVLPEGAFKCHYNVPVNVAKGRLHVGLIGVGGYAKNVHIPNIRKLNNIIIKGVVSKSGASAAVAARKVNASYASSDVTQLLNDREIDAVIISTRHSSHAKLVLDSLAAGKHVFVEKPMAITVKDCLRIVEAQRDGGCIVRVGYNRRFSPYLQQMKKAIGGGPKVFNMRINVGAISRHWSSAAEEGGRLMGEGVHFFDLGNWIIEDIPKTVIAQYMGDPHVSNADVAVSVGYEDGSIVNIVYTTVGHTGLGKEYFEIFGNGRAVIVDDYKKIVMFGCGSQRARKGKGDKGQLAAMKEFSQAILEGAGGGGADSLAGLWATAIAEAALKSAITGCVISMEEFVKC